MSGVGTLLRLFLRRDRWLLLWWTVGITVLFWSQAVGVDGIYSTQQEFDAAAAVMERNTALIAMAGPARALNTIGGQVMWQAAAFGAIALGLMLMLVVGRHTRGEEDSGRDELLRGSPVGRHATMLATTAEVLLACLLVGAAVAASLVAYPLAVADSVGVGAGLAGCGLLLGGTTLLLAQLTSSVRATYGWTGVVLGLAYLLRAIGDVTGPALSWVSPIGWYQAMHPFSGLRWWPLLLLLGGALVVNAAAWLVLDRRDLGSGVLPERAGPATGGPGLGTPVGLAWRLQRGSVLGWAVGLGLTGLGYGSMGTEVGEVMGDSQFTRDVMVAQGAALVEGFYSVALLMLALMGSGFAISSALRPRQEEEAARTELLAAVPLPRWRLLAGHAVVTVLGSVLVLGAGGVGLGVGFGLSSGDWALARELMTGIAGYLAPVLLLAGLAWLLYGVLPRWAGLAWTGLAVAVVVMFFGDLLDLPQRLQDVSPFEHVALVPASGFAAAPVLVITALAVVATVLGHVAFARRDLL